MIDNYLFEHTKPCNNVIEMKSVVVSALLENVDIASTHLGK